MKNLACRLIFLLFALPYFACEEAEQPPVLPDPVSFTIAFEGDTALLHQVERVWVESDRPDEISKLSFYLNGSLIGALVDEPFEMMWDTGEHPDGAYTLRVVAEDVLGRESQQSVSLILSNTLFKLSLPQVYKKLDTPQLRGENDDQIVKTLWVYITNEAGEMIGKAFQVAEGGEVSWQRPKGFRGSFNYHEVWHGSYRSHAHFHNLYTYRNFPQKHFNKEEDYPAVKGTATITYREEEQLEESPSVLVRNRGFDASIFHFEEGMEVQQVPIYTESDRIVAYYDRWDWEKGQSLNYMLPRLSPGDEKVYDYDAFKKAEIRPLGGPSNPYEYHDVNTGAYWMVDGQALLIDFYESRYPSDVPWYAMPIEGDIPVPYVRARLAHEGGIYTTYVLPEEQARSPLPPLSHQAVAVRQDNGTLRYELQGDMDVVYAYWDTPGNPGRSIYLEAFEYQDPAQLQHINFPSPPDTLLQAIPTLRQALGASAYAEPRTHSVDYANIKGYAGFISKVVEAPANNNAFLENTGGYTANAVPFSE